MKPTHSFRPPRELEAELGYTFADPSYLIHALTHPSRSNEIPHGKPPLPHYEQLEFLGDAVLSFAVADFLYRHFPTVPEGVLSAARKSVVERKALCGYASQISLGEYLRFGNGAQTLRNNPSTLENAFEALIGALYCDGGIELAKAFVLRFMEADLRALIPSLLRAGAATDCKTRLQQFIQSDSQPHTIEYLELDREGPDHAPTFTVGFTLDGTVIGTGRGSSKRGAEEQAARRALQYFKLEPNDP